MVKIYLAGGFHGTWRDDVKNAIRTHLGIARYERVKFIDPLEPELDSEGKRKMLSFEEYTAWDLWAIRTSDITFVYSERTNPGQGYIVEAGYAKGLGKTVILVREEDNMFMPDKYLKFLDCIADYKTNNLAQAIEVLKRFSY